MKQYTKEQLEALTDEQALALMFEFYSSLLEQMPLTASDLWPHASERDQDGEETIGYYPTFQKALRAAEKLLAEEGAESDKHADLKLKGYQVKHDSMGYWAINPMGSSILRGPARTEQEAWLACFNHAEGGS